MKRILLAGLVGGIVMFVWGALSHTILPLGEMGLSTLPNEDLVMQALKANITEPGLYFYPGMDMSADMSKEQQALWEAKYKAGPVGLILFHPEGGDVMPPSQLITELVTNVIAAFFVGSILVHIAGPFRRRVAVVGLIGVIGWVSISLSYWNWYRFPTQFIVAEGLDQAIGWTLVGIVLAKMVRAQQA